MTLVESVRAAAETVGVEPRDRAVLDLATVYAGEIDLGGDLAKLGPALLAALEALGLSPRARKAVKSDGQQSSANPLDQLAQRRAGRRPAPPVDAAAP